MAAEAGRALQAAAAADPHLAAALLGATTTSNAMHNLTLISSGSSSGSSAASGASGSAPTLASSIGQQVAALLEGGDATLRGRLLGLVLPLLAQQLAAGSLPMTGGKGVCACVTRSPFQQPAPHAHTLVMSWSRSTGLLSKTVLHPCLKWQGAVWFVMEGMGSAIPRWLISPPSAAPLSLSQARCSSC